MLPARDGWSVLRELRERGRQMPVLFLTARGEVPDRVRGLELGADDYLAKPCVFTELLAWVRALLRRRASASRMCYRSEPASSNTGRNSVCSVNLPSGVALQWP